VIAAVEKAYGKPADELLKTLSSNRLSCEARGLPAWATYELSGATLTELAQFCRRDVATLCHAARRAETLAEKDSAVFLKKRFLEQELTAIPSTTASPKRKDDSQEN
jgi:hypothetical protein